MKKIYSKTAFTKHEFEVVERIPANYIVWNIGNNMVNGYLPFAQPLGYGHKIDTETLKAIPLEQEKINTVNYAASEGLNTIEKMENYIKKYQSNQKQYIIRKVKAIKEALLILYDIR